MADRANSTSRAALEFTPCALSLRVFPSIVALDTANGSMNSSANDEAARPCSINLDTALNPAKPEVLEIGQAISAESRQGSGPRDLGEILITELLEDYVQ